MSRPGYAQTQEQGHNLLRAQLLNAAGISFERQAKLLEKAVKKLEAKLDAKSTEIISYQGEITDTVELDDHAAQLRASEALIDVLGAKPSKQSGDSQGDVIVQIIFPQACQPTSAIDVTPQPVVVEVQKREALPEAIEKITS